MLPGLGCFSGGVVTLVSDCGFKLWSSKMKVLSGLPHSCFHLDLLLGVFLSCLPSFLPHLYSTPGALDCSLLKISKSRAELLSWPAGQLTAFRQVLAGFPRRL